MFSVRDTVFAPVSDSATLFTAAFAAVSARMPHDPFAGSESVTVAPSATAPSSASVDASTSANPVTTAGAAAARLTVTV